ncbi:hypothetical protein ACJ6WF_26845 [Streptomyces sp. MMS24-I2-30]|uniref:hypothetical protein n=1 Tax=Streptomyces sp. MMS24-I2-30 TaxID=3351564 RepID=UPI003896B516
MEQRIGSSSQPLEGAGFDPAFIPGITAPVPAERQGTEPADAAETDDPASADAEAPAAKVSEPVSGKATEQTKESEEESESAKGPESGTETESVQDPESDTDPESEKDAESVADDEDEQDEQDGEDSSDGPVFEAADRRARIVADQEGVRLRLDEESCEFRWDEIGAVETESPRFGKRFTITVHTPDNRWYPIEIEATARARFKEWEDQLDAVLDAYFEE